MIDKKYAIAATIIFANVLTQPLIDDIRNVFGTAIMHHPYTVWVVLFSLVYDNTKSVRAAIMTVLAYEAIKYVWRKHTPETPRVARLRKILQTVNQDAEMDKEDIQFIDQVTPSDITFSKAEK